MSLSAVIVVRDEEANVAACVRSVRWADEVLVVDTGSTDATVQVCRDLGVRVEQVAWEGFGPTKQHAVELAAHDWVLSVDADERVTDSLAEEVRTLLAGVPEHAAYRVKRRSHYLGREIRHAGWGRDWVLRLFDRTQGGFRPLQVHEYVRSNGTKGRLKGHLLHYPYPDVVTHRVKMRRYAAIAARLRREQGKRPGRAGALIRAAARFVRMYLVQGGFLDGWEGLLLCTNSMYGVYLKYAMRDGGR